MNDKHTPGPWGWVIHDASMATLCGENAVGGFNGIDPHVMSVSPCRSCAENKDEWQWDRCTTPSEADARLIAAAPSMLKVLQFFTCIDFDNFTEHDDLLLKNVKRDAAAAVAKAIGES